MRRPMHGAAALGQQAGPSSKRHAAGAGRTSGSATSLAMKNRGLIAMVLSLFCMVVLGSLGGFLAGFDAGSILALVSLLVSIATLLGLYAQNRHLQSQVRSMQAQTGISVSDAAYTKSFEMLQVFIEHPELWCYFHEGREVGPDCPAERRSQLEAMSLLLLDYFSLVDDVYRAGEADPSDRESSISYLRHGVRQSPVLRTVYARHAEWYPRLKRYFDEATSR